MVKSTKNWTQEKRARFTVGAVGNERGSWVLSITDFPNLRERELVWMGGQKGKGGDPLLKKVSKEGTKSFFWDAEERGKKKNFSWLERGGNMG